MGLTLTVLGASAAWSERPGRPSSCYMLEIGEEVLGQTRAKVFTSASAYLCHGVFVTVGLTIGTRLQQRTETIGQAQDAGAERYGFRDKTVGIAGTVVILVMVENNLAHLRRRLQRRENREAKRYVLGHR